MENDLKMTAWRKIRGSLTVDVILGTICFGLASWLITGIDKSQRGQMGLIVLFMMIGTGALARVALKLNIDAKLKKLSETEKRPNKMQDDTARRLADPQH